MISNFSHKFNETILRAYDIRGILEETLSVKDAYAIGLAFGTLLQVKFSGRKVCVGYDGRLSSPELAENLIKGLKLTGLDILDVGCGPSPMLYYSVYSEGADAGIMITGSHNPPNFNGFKFMMPKNVFYGENIKELGEIAVSGLFKYQDGSKLKKNIEEDYVNNLLKNIKLPEKIKLGSKI